MVRLPKFFGTSSTRRKFLRSGLAAPAVIGAGLAVHSSTLAFADSDGPTFGDISILRFLAALEILETDLWEQYNELGGIQDSEERPGSGNKLYTAQLANIVFWQSKKVLTGWSILAYNADTLAVRQR